MFNYRVSVRQVLWRRNWCTKTSTWLRHARPCVWNMVVNQSTQICLTKTRLCWERKNQVNLYNLISNLSFLKLLKIIMQVPSKIAGYGYYSFFLLIQCWKKDFGPEYSLITGCPGEEIPSIYPRDIPCSKRNASLNETVSCFATAIHMYIWPTG